MNDEALRLLIRERGLRVTASRVGVLALLVEEARPLSHAEVAEALQDGHWDQATLYRNLMDLSEAGLLSRVALGSIWHFEVASAKGEHHPHFVCVECGTVECTPELKLSLPKGRGAPAALRRGEVSLQMHGICDACTPA